MKPAYKLLLCLSLSLQAGTGWSSDACSTRGVRTSADVVVSDGSTFRTETFFQSKDSAAIKQISNDERLIAVEGPLAWTRTGDTANPGEDFHKSFALGHQIHAFLLHFEDIVSNVRVTERTRFNGNIHRSISGDQPYGGVAHLIQGQVDDRPAGLLFESPDTPAISMTFLDWREVDKVSLPYHVRMDDGERIFDYHYRSIDLTPQSPLWFFEVTGAPDIDAVQIYRLHRKLLAAHCLGDADLMADLSALQITLASRGEILQTTNQSLRERFKSLFQQLDYTEYHDIKTPVIETSARSDLGWIWVNVRAVGSERASGESFDDQWAWVMLVRKINGEWRHIGNASNVAG